MSNPCWGPRHARQAAGILVKLKIKKGVGCNQNIQRLKIR